MCLICFSKIAHEIEKSQKMSSRSCSFGLFCTPSCGALIIQNRDENSMRRKRRQIRLREFSIFAEIIFEASFIDNLRNGFFYPQLNWRSTCYLYLKIEILDLLQNCPLFILFLSKFGNKIS